MRHPHRVTVASALALLCVLVLALAVAPALAADPTDTGYDESGVLKDFATGGEPPAKQEAAAPAAPRVVRESGGGLPFTGLDLAFVVLMGGALVGTGLVVRRGTRDRDADA